MIFMVFVIVFALMRTATKLVHKKISARCPSSDWRKKVLINKVDGPSNDICPTHGFIIGPFWASFSILLMVYNIADDWIRIADL